MNKMEPAVIIAVIAAFGTILGPAIAQVIRSFTDKHLKRLDLFYAARSEAYRLFLEVADDPKLDVAALSRLKSEAVLFSSRKTAKAIEAYSAERTSKDMDLTRLYDLKARAIKAMQKNIAKPHMR